MKVKPIILMFCYARSGGTLLNRCLSCLPSTIIFSEINPEAVCPTKINTLIDQSKHWYNLRIKKTSFINEIKQIKKLCDNNNKYLIIRDWNFGSFVPLKYNSFKPSSTLALFDTIKLAGIKTRKFAFVRNAKDVWLSMYSSNKTFHDRQLKYLLEFTKLIIKKKVKVFKYENFCLDPVTEMKKICEYLEIPYSTSFLEFTKSMKATGDIDSPTPSRGVKQGKISSLPRRTVPIDIVNEIEKNTLANEINSMLGYQ